MYDTETMKKIAEEDLGDSPSVLSLYYDESTSVLYATGKVGYLKNCFTFNIFFVFENFRLTPENLSLCPNRIFPDKLYKGGSSREEGNAMRVFVYPCKGMLIHSIL